jgi:hypothetical protein
MKIQRPELAEHWRPGEKSFIAQGPVLCLTWLPSTGRDGAVIRDGMGFGEGERGAGRGRGILKTLLPLD